MKRGILTTAITSLGLIASAEASISVGLVPVAIPGGVTDSGFVPSAHSTYDLRVTTTGSSDWLVGAMKMTITGGTLYNHAFGSDDPPNGALVGAFPSLAYDSYVSSASGTAAATKLPYPGDPAFVLGPSAISATWNDTVNTGVGTFTIARLTFTNGSTGTLAGSVTESTNPTSEVPFSFAVPEPTSLATLGLAAALVLRRRTQRL